MREFDGENKIMNNFCLGALMLIIPIMLLFISIVREMWISSDNFKEWIREMIVVGAMTLLVIAIIIFILIAVCFIFA